MDFVKRLLLRISSVGFAMFLLGCQSFAEKAAIPAIVVEPSEEAMAEIKGVIKQALNSDEIMFASKVFTERSILAIDKSGGRAIDKPDAMGRVMDMPYRFQLLKSNDGCLLHQLDTDKRWALTKVKCKAVD